MQGFEGLEVNDERTKGPCSESFDFVPLVNEDEDGRSTISLVVVGHVDAGKSTINGHLLCLLGSVDKVR